MSLRREIFAGGYLLPAAMVREAEQFVERWGFKSLKVKGGVLHPDLEVETMLALRERFPGFQWLQLGRICSTFGWGLGQHSNSHLGITMAAMTHLAAAVPNLMYASDSHYPWIEEDIIAGPMFTFEDGFQQVPSGPGLGVKLDEDKLGKYAELYRSRPAHSRDDVAEMRKRDPSWVPLKPRW